MLADVDGENLIFHNLLA